MPMAVAVRSVGGAPLAGAPVSERVAAAMPLISAGDPGAVPGRAITR